MTGKTKNAWRWRVGLGIVAVMAAAGIFFWKWMGGLKTVKNPPSISGQVFFTVPGSKALRFDDFLIPLPADAAHTCISFSVAIRYRNPVWSTMPDQEKKWLRARIYDMLVTRMQKLENPPSVDVVAYWTNQAIKQALSNRPFDEVVVDNVFIL